MLLLIKFMEIHSKYSIFKSLTRSCLLKVPRLEGFVVGSAGKVFKFDGRQQAAGRCAL